MQCGSEDTLQTEGNIIKCASCGKSWEIDAHCRLKGVGEDTNSLHDLKDWADMHREKVKEKTSSGSGVLTVTENVTVQNENDDRTFVNTNTGKAVLTSDTLSLETESGTVSWPVSEIEDCVVQKKDLFEFRHKERYVRFLFNKKSPMKWVYYLRYLKNYEDFEKRGYL